MGDYVVRLKAVGMGNVAQVGGKNASLGEMINHLGDMGIAVPGGFATTADAFRAFLSHADLTQRIASALDTLDVDDVSELACTGENMREWIATSDLPGGLHDATVSAYTEMQAEAGGSVSVAVRSSATAEDLPEASFAGQQETYLNVSSLENLLQWVDVAEGERERFCLTDFDLLELARQAVTIEKHYGRPMDIEWGKDGVDGRLYILQARPETVQSRGSQTIERFVLKGSGEVVVEGRSVGQRIASGKARIINDLTLGLDHDSRLVASSFDERDPAVKALLYQAIQSCKKVEKYVGICGQRPSDHPDLAKWLLEQGISGVSLNSDTVVETWMYMAGLSGD